jgi:DNA-binding IclR family transcriptional regulator
MTVPMPEDNQAHRQVDQFIREEIDSVPHLEALLLFWRRRPHRWSVEEMSRSLYISVEATHTILQELRQRGMVTLEDGVYSYDSGFRHGNLMEEVDRTYRRELVRLSRMIHSKASPAVREFARAFKFKKD